MMTARTGGRSSACEPKTVSHLPPPRFAAVRTMATMPGRSARSTSSHASTMDCGSAGGRTVFAILGGLNNLMHAVTPARWLPLECRAANHATMGVSGSPATSLSSCHRVYWGLPRLSKQHPQRRISLDAPHDVVEGCSCLIPAPSKYGRMEMGG